jgi:poly(A) polymerase
VQIPDVPPQLLAALVEAAAGQRLALVGGVVRDLLLHRHHQDPWRGLPDLDLVVEGRAADLVERLPQALEHEFGRPVPIREQHHGRYGTAEVELELPPDCGGTWLLDVASARQEFYPQPGANPVVRPGSLEQDLARRDFTVNAMALVLNPPGADVGAELELLDPFGGQVDLAQRELRFLHPHSLRDDPTRLVRAARYAARLEFRMASSASHQATTTIQDWPWLWTFGDPPEQAPPALAGRLRRELELLLNQSSWRNALSILKHCGGLSLFASRQKTMKISMYRFHWAQSLGITRSMAFVRSTCSPVELAIRLQFPHRDVMSMRQSINLDYVAKADQPKRPSEWTALIESVVSSSDAVSLSIIGGLSPRQPLLSWLIRWRHVQSLVTAKELLSRGLVPGPLLGKELKTQRLKNIDSLYW